MIPPKPEHVTWTDDQWKAIYAQGQDILVAAAAGSGKTAVLVERMIEKIISAEDPINVDELLVVTFTNASAAEMRHRIAEALEKAIQKDPSSRHLRRQLSLLNRASISTLHSFCLEVIRKNYYKIDIDPAFRIADETEAQLLRDEVMEQLFEDEYGKEANEEFYRLVDAFSNDRSDVAIQDIIRDIFDFAKSNPAPSEYLQGMLAMYKVDESTAIEELPFASALLYDIELQLEGAKQQFNKALDLTRLPGGPAPRAENLIDDIQIMDRLLNAKRTSWEQLYNEMQTINFTRAKPCKKELFDADLLERTQKLRDKTKKLVQSLSEELFSRKPESFIRDMQEMARYVQTLVTLVEEFSIRFDQVKKEKGIVDFADLEHYCLRILMENDGSASEVALTYRQRFKEVFVDEYQDTNMVQEAILRLVTKESEEHGNLFMVGDVKQSIYRFRLAEPNLFLGKYNRFSADGQKSGLKIDLAKNFRSRKEVLSGTNFLFKQLMGTKVGEIEYDEAAELVQGAAYPEDNKFPIELILVDHEKQEAVEAEQEEDSQGNDEEYEDLAQSEAEAKWIAAKIKSLIAEKTEVYNPKTKSNRPIMYKDVVILLRSMTWAPQIMEECKEQGIPIYANLSTGYFEAIEVSIMMSLLKIIDNPYQDIPLASVLRSPIVGLCEEELALVRIENKRVSYYEALRSFIERRPNEENGEMYDKLTHFVTQLEGWRTNARQGSLAELIWRLFRETRYYDFVGGLPGGKQRQANLRALYDRARQYEETSFRGLFRFLRFIDRMRERGDDLGAARALGEQEDVVRIMTIHSSKGLEFPVVFIAGLARSFNMLDLRRAYMLDKDFGFAARFVDPEKRIAYPSLPQLAFKRKKKLEMLAEEMRVLYVALTRAKEKLYLLASVNKLSDKLEEWSQQCANTEWLIQDYERATAKGYIDWIGPAVIRHRDSERIRVPLTNISLVPTEISEHPSSWHIEIIKAVDIASRTTEELREQDEWMFNVMRLEQVDAESDWKKEIEERLSWVYPLRAATIHRSKQSVSEMKRQQELRDDSSGHELMKSFRKPISTRPRFMQEKALTPAERGTAMHMVMQHVDLKKEITVEVISQQLDEMVMKELLTTEQQESINVAEIVQFFETPIGKRLLRSEKVHREVPFSFSVPATKVYANWQGEDEQILIQGVIDCMFEEDGQLVLLDFKTDGIHDRFKNGFTGAKPIMEERYRVQITLYTSALERILKKNVAEKYLYFFDGGHLLEL